MKPTVEDYKRIAARIAEMKAEIPQKAATDPEFHDALKANPQATIEKFYGLPEGLLKDIDIRIFEEAPGSIGIVIPPRASTDESELTEEQLEAVAGGAGFVGAGAVIGVAGIVGILGGITLAFAEDDYNNGRDFGW